MRKLVFGLAFLHLRLWFCAEMMKLERVERLVVLEAQFGKTGVLESWSLKSIDVLDNFRAGILWKVIRPLPAQCH
ncbi:hypothetical protein [Vibrio hyugaensis]|uniref:hypothetical protein n=1 Tax=Vibrio hyugaensis TaxID=1534743 RepID=UPI0005F02050|nr:hypothetical protein [Vibrio hyugaensis]